MNVFDTFRQQYEFNRGRTLGLLDRIEQEPQPQRILGWRPGPGRAHIAWQLMHVGITEELFASERLVQKPGRFHELRERFRGGSTPDDNIPSAAEIRDVLSGGRADLLETLASFQLSQLNDILWEARDGRRLSLLNILQTISWHEAHHQGQSHITLNLYKVTMG